MEYKTFTLKLTEKDLTALQKAAKNRKKHPSQLVRSILVAQLADEGFTGEVGKKGGDRRSKERAS